MKKITRIGIGGPVGSGKTTIMEAITPRLIAMGAKILVITNDVVNTTQGYECASTGDTSARSTRIHKGALDNLGTSGITLTRRTRGRGSF